VNPHAPLYTATYDLAAWLLGHLDREPSVLAREMCRLALRLLDAAVFALKDRERLERLDEMDELLLRLRQRIRLGRGTGLFDERQALHALALCDLIGRQVGGWLRTLEGAE
jgi:hypothetical protein